MNAVIIFRQREETMTFFKIFSDTIENKLINLYISVTAFMVTLIYYFYVVSKQRSSLCLRETPFGMTALTAKVSLWLQNSLMTQTLYFM